MIMDFYLYNNPTENEDNNLSSSYNTYDSFDGSKYNNWRKIIAFDRSNEDRYDTIRNTSFIFDLKTNSDYNLSKIGFSFDDVLASQYHKYSYNLELPSDLNYNQYSFEFFDTAFVFQKTGRNKIDKDAIDLIITRTQRNSEFLFYKNSANPSYAILNTAGIKKENSSDEYVLLGGGGHKKLSEISGGGGGSGLSNSGLAIIIDSSSYSVTEQDTGKIFYLKQYTNVDLSGLQDNATISFRLVSGYGAFFDGGTLNKIFTNPTSTSLQGKPGSTAVVSRFENNLFIDIRNVE